MSGWNNSFAKQPRLPPARLRQRHRQASERDSSVISPPKDDFALLREGTDEVVVVGTVGKPYGVRGWNHIRSHTDPAAEIVEFEGWLLRGPDGWERAGIEQVRIQSGRLTARFRGCESRDDAVGLTGTQIGVVRNSLPDPEDGEYYWADLVGCSVVTIDGTSGGRIVELMETGAHDVMVVRDGSTEYLVPFVIDEVVTEVDYASRSVTVDWVFEN